MKDRVRNKTRTISLPFGESAVRLLCCTSKESDTWYIIKMKWKKLTCVYLDNTRRVRNSVVAREGEKLWRSRVGNMGDDRRTFRTRGNIPWSVHVYVRNDYWVIGRVKAVSRRVSVEERWEIFVDNKKIGKVKRYTVCPKSFRTYNESRAVV